MGGRSSPRAGRMCGSRGLHAPRCMDIGRVRALCAVRCIVHGVLRSPARERIGRSARAALCASETVRRQTGSVCIAAHVSFSRTREWCRATTHRPPGPLPLQSLVARGSVRGAFGPVYYAAVPPPTCARARAALVGSHARASARATQTRADGGWKFPRQTHGALCREHWRAGGAERAAPGVPQPLEYPEYPEYSSHSPRACDGGRKTDRCHSCSS